MIASPCPFCGSRLMHVEEWIGMVIISCPDCLAIGPITAEQSQAQAWARWNARHGPETGQDASGYDGCCSHLPHVPVDFELDDFV